MFDVASAYAALLPAALALPAVSSLAVSGVEPPSCRPRQVFASPAVASNGGAGTLRIPGIRVQAEPPIRYSAEKPTDSPIV